MAGKIRTIRCPSGGLDSCGSPVYVLDASSSLLGMIITDYFKYYPSLCCCLSSVFRLLAFLNASLLVIKLNVLFCMQKTANFQSDLHDKRLSSKHLDVIV